MKNKSIPRTKSNKIPVKQERVCFICQDKFEFDEYKEIFLYLSTFDNPIENFFKLLNSERDLVCSSSVNLKKTWKNLKKKIFCPRCLLNFKHAYALTKRCFRCGREISFNDCSWSNFNKKFSREELMEYWINPIIQFYCCSCYREEKKKFKSKSL